MQEVTGSIPVSPTTWQWVTTPVVTHCAFWIHMRLQALPSRQARISFLMFPGVKRSGGDVCIVITRRCQPVHCAPHRRHPRSAPPAPCPVSLVNGSYFSMLSDKNVEGCARVLRRSCSVSFQALVNCSTRFLLLEFCNFYVPLWFWSTLVL